MNSTVLPIIAPNENKQNTSKKVKFESSNVRSILKHIHSFQAACEFKIQIWVVNTFDVKISCWFWNWIAFIIFKNLQWNIISTLYIYDHEILTLLFYTMMLFKFRLWFYINRNFFLAHKGEFLSNYIIHTTHYEPTNHNDSLFPLCVIILNW